MKALSLIILSLSFIACQPIKVNENRVEYIIYGTYCGECIKSCTRMYRLDSTKILRDTTDDYFKNNNSLVFDKSPLSKEHFLKAKKILDSIPQIILDSRDSTFGQPDNRDQCGIFLQIKTSNNLKTFHIDTNLRTLPKELKHYATLLMQNP